MRVRSSYSGLGRSLGTIPKELKKNDLFFASNREDESVGLAATITMKGEWIARTPQAVAWLETYGPMMSKYQTLAGSSPTLSRKPLQWCSVTQKPYCACGADFHR